MPVSISISIGIGVPRAVAGRADIPFHVASAAEKFCSAMAGQCLVSPSRWSVGAVMGVSRRQEQVQTDAMKRKSRED